MNLELQKKSYSDGRTTICIPESFHTIAFNLWESYNTTRIFKRLFDLFFSDIHVSLKVSNYKTLTKVSMNESNFVISERRKDRVFL